MSWNEKAIKELIKLRERQKLTWDELATIFDEYSPNALRKAYYRHAEEPKVPTKPGAKVLIFDIETAPIEAFVWGLWDQTVGLNQIIKDWAILSWSAKWLGSDEVMYMDNRNESDCRNDEKIVRAMHKLLDEADVVVTQNGVKFDEKKLNSRFLKYKLKRPSSFRHIDTYKIAQRAFAHTSNKLEYMTKNFCTNNQKLSHGEFPGFDLWREICLNGPRVKKAWEEMEKYNRMDVLSLEELFLELRGWDNSINFAVFTDHEADACGSCGSDALTKKGFRYSNFGKYQRFQCRDCGAEFRGRENLLSKEKRKSLKVR